MERFQIFFEVCKVICEEAREIYQTSIIRIRPDKLEEADNHMRNCTICIAWLKNRVEELNLKLAEEEGRSLVRPKRRLK